MAASFQVRIEDIIGATLSLGSDSGTDNEQAIQDALQDTASDILNKVRPDILIQYATKSSNVTSNPLASNVENSRILLVERRGDDGAFSLYVSCVFSDVTLQGKLQNPNSIYFATDESPRWTFNDNDIYVYPELAAGNPARYYSMNNPTIEHGATSVTAFPNELEHALVLGASARLKQRTITSYNEDEDAEIVALHRAQWAELEQKYKDALAPYIATSE